MPRTCNVGTRWINKSLERSFMASLLTNQSASLNNANALSDFQTNLNLTAVALETSSVGESSKPAAAGPVLDTTSKFRGSSLAGLKFNRLTVVSYAGKNYWSDAYWNCLCDCGTMTVVSGNNLKRGGTKSCGCWAADPASHQRPFNNNKETFWLNVIKQPNGCWEWTGRLSDDGYGMFNYNRKRFLAHRFSWFLHRGAWPTKPYVCHHCDNPKCVNPDHLFEGTAYDNNHDAISKGRIRHWGRPKITPEQVVEIRNLYASGKFSYTSLAGRLNLPRTQIFSALNKWKTLPLYATT